MKVTIIYGTLSGSTMSAADVVTNTLASAGIDAHAVSVDGASKDMIAASDAVIFASPSWEDNGQDGQPLPEMTAFLGSLTSADLQNKKIAVFGLGDTMYPHFCGAVDVMSTKLKDLGVSLVVDPVRVDRYYSVPENEQKVKDWASSLEKALKSA